MDNLFFTSPEIEEWCSLSQLREKYNITFDQSGWYPLSNGDTALVIERHAKYRISLWVRMDPRDEMEKLLDLQSFD